MLCQPSIAGRCNAAEALVHPFITRDLNAPLPTSDFESRELALQNLPLERKLRKLIGVVFSCAVIRPKISNRGEDSETTREETKQSSSLDSIDQQLAGYKKKVLRYSEYGDEALIPKKTSGIKVTPLRNNGSAESTDLE